MANTANNAKNQATKPAFRRKNSKAAWPVDHYVLQIKPSGWAWSDLATVDGAGLTMVDYTPMVDLTANTLYQWRVNACNDLEPAQCSGFSKPRKFKTAP